MLSLRWSGSGMLSSRQMSVMDQLLQLLSGDRGPVCVVERHGWYAVVKSGSDGRF